MFSYGRTPYGNMTEKEVVDEVLTSDFRLQRPVACPARLHEVALRLWSMPRRARPAFSSVHAELILQSRPQALGSGASSAATVQGPALSTGGASLERLEYARSRLDFVHSLSQRTAFGSLKVFQVAGSAGGADDRRNAADAMTLVMVHEMEATCTTEEQASFMAELRLLSTLQHPNVLALLGVCTFSLPMLGVMEYPTLGSLDMVVSAQAHGEGELMRVALDVSLGAGYLADCGVVQRGLLCCERCFVDLVDGHLHAKVMAVGLSRIAQDKDYYRMTTSSELRIRTMAPESLVSLRFTPASDVYSLGIVIFRVFARMQVPFAFQTDDELLAMIRNKTAPPQLSRAVCHFFLFCSFFFGFSLRTFIDGSRGTPRDCGAGGRVHAL